MLEYMVDKDGMPYEVIVVDSTHEDFEANALKAVQMYEYSPATLGNEPVNSRCRSTMRFLMGADYSYADSEFAHRYNSINKMFAKSKLDQEMVRKRLDSLYRTENLTQYSLAHIYVLEALYATRFLDEKEQLEPLRKILFFDRKTKKKRIF